MKSWWTHSQGQGTGKEGDGVRRYTIAPLDAALHKPYSIVASSADSAWAKFRTQYFGALKPNRAEYTVTADKLPLGSWSAMQNAECNGY